MSRCMYWPHRSFRVSPLIITIEYVTLTWILLQSDFQTSDIDSDFLQHWLKRFAGEERKLICLLVLLFFAHRNSKARGIGRNLRQVQGYTGASQFLLPGCNTVRDVHLHQRV